MTTISDICAKAREEGWRFEYRNNYITALHIDELPLRVLGITRYNFIENDKLGHAIAAAMNGEEG